jgi:hypothetical protein
MGLMKHLTPIFVDKWELAIKRHQFGYEMAMKRQSLWKYIDHFMSAGNRKT